LIPAPGNFLWVKVKSPNPALSINIGGGNEMKNNLMRGKMLPTGSRLLDRPASIERSIFRETLIARYAVSGVLGNSHESIHLFWVSLDHGKPNSL
jgi:hypothetical protein